MCFIEFSCPNFFSSYIWEHERNSNKIDRQSLKYHNSKLERKSETIKSNIRLFSCTDIIKLVITPKIHYFIFLRFGFYSFGSQTASSPSFYLRNVTLQDMFKISSKLISFISFNRDIPCLRNIEIFTFTYVNIQCLLTLPWQSVSVLFYFSLYRITLENV